MAAIELGLNSELIEGHVRSWVARSALIYDERLALSDGLTGVLTAEEVAVMGRENASELDGLFKIVEIDRSAALRNKLSRTISGLQKDDEAVTQILEDAACELGLSFPQTGDTAKIFRRSVLRNMMAYLDSTHASLMGHPIPDQIIDWLPPCKEAISRQANISVPNANIIMSLLCENFTTSKVEDESWKRSEKISARSTLRLWIQVSGDKYASSYTGANIEKFRRVIKSISSDYYHNKK